MRLAVSADVFTENQEHAAKAAEVLARAAVGLLLDGVQVTVSMSVLDEEDDE